MIKRYNKRIIISIIIFGILVFTFGEVVKNNTKVTYSNNCPAGYNYSSNDDICIGEPNFSCPSGGNYNGKGDCNLSISGSSCPANYTKTSSSVSVSCVGTPNTTSCASGTKNSDGTKCISTASPTYKCTRGNYNGKGDCNYSKAAGEECISGYVGSTSGTNCVGTPYASCAAGTLNSSSNMCEIISNLTYNCLYGNYNGKGDCNYSCKESCPASYIQTGSTVTSVCLGTPNATCNSNGTFNSAAGKYSGYCTVATLSKNIDDNDTGGGTGGDTGGSPSPSSPSPSSPSPSSPSPSNPSDSFNNNPKTGTIGIFIAWSIAIVTLTYSCFYFKKIK